MVGQLGPAFLKGNFMIKVWKYGVTTNGIKTRCRKTERHYFDKLGQSEELDEQRCKDLAEMALADNMKSYDRAKTFATATLWTINGDMEQWQPFTASHNLKFAMVAI
jgi:hypothetical protein